MKKNIILTSLTAITLAVPALADPVVPNISPSAESADCTQPVLGTTTGTSNLQASWTPNTLNIDWYNGETKLTSNTCTYDSGITVPPTNPSKTGYTFAGWTVKAATAPSQPQQTTINLSTLFGPNDICEMATDAGWKGDNRLNEANNYQTTEYGLTDDNTWAVEFSYGTVKGIASCNNTPGADWSETGIFTTATSDTYNQSSTGQYCWCRATSYTPLNDFEQPISSSSWMFVYDVINASYCAHECAFLCMDHIGGLATLRGAMFGVSGGDMCPEEE